MRKQRIEPDAPVHRRRQQPSLTPAERSLRARVAAYARHAGHDPQKATAKARAAFLDRFEREADPDGVLSPKERARRAAHLRSAYFARLALASAQARRSRQGDVA